MYGASAKTWQSRLCACVRRGICENRQTEHRAILALSRSDHVSIKTCSTYSILKPRAQESFLQTVNYNNNVKNPT